jgi:flagellar M-ring protein FliF
VYPKQITPPESAKSEAGTYGVSKSVRHVIQNPGRLRRMTAAIVVNDRLMRAATKGAAAQWLPWPPEALRNLTMLAQASVGFDASRGDVLTVEDLAFDENRAPPQASAAKQLLASAENSPILTKYAALLLGLLVVLAFGVRPALKRSRIMTHEDSVKAQGKSRSGELEEEKTAQPALLAPEPAPMDPERRRAQEIFEQVTDHLKREPTQSSRLLQSWIHSE